MYLQFSSGTSLFQMEFIYQYFVNFLKMNMFSNTNNMDIFFHSPDVQEERIPFIKSYLTLEIFTNELAR